MFQNDDDEDFNFNLDDVLSVNKTEKTSTPLTSNNKQNGSPVNNSQFSSTQVSSQQVSLEDWGSDDDETAFLEIDTNITIENSQPFKNDKLTENIPVQVVEPDVCVRKFPGPAGLVLKSKEISSEQRKTNEPNNEETSKVDMEYLYGWSKAINKLEIGNIWKSMKASIKWIKNNYFPCSFVSIKVPFLLVGIKCIQSAKADINCIVQDPTGETRSTIHQAVVEEHGRKIKVGSVLLLRRPAILISGPCPYLVTVTKKSLLAIVVPGNEHSKQSMSRCADYSRVDLQSWSSEEIECEELTEELEDLSSAIQTHQSPRLFTAYHSTPPAASSRLKAPSLKQASSAAIRSSISPLQQRPVGVATSASPASSFRNQNMKSSVSNLPRMNSPSAASSCVPVQLPKPQPAIDKQFMEQLLDGLDTDALFDDF